MRLNSKGVVLIEALFASFILIISVNAFSLGFIYNQQAPFDASLRQQAIAYSREGLEAVRTIRDANNGIGSLQSNLGPKGLVLTAGNWGFSGTSDTDGGLSRVVTLSSPGPNDLDVTSTVNWNGSNGRVGQVSLSRRLTNWRMPSVAGGGMIIYGDGSTTTDAITYNNIDTTGNWGTPATAADIDTGSTNRALRGAKLFASKTRDEKILVSRHYNGTTTYIYSQVWNGTTGLWGNVLLLSSFAGAINGDPFDGTYLANGDFMVTYSQNTTVPAMQVWNGTNWLGAAVTMTAITGNPVSMVLKARPGTNEAMLAVFGSTNRSMTRYFSGASYVTASWSAVTIHSTASPVANSAMIDFEWSKASPTIGQVIYPNSATSLVVTTKKWTANGTGGGAWGGAVNTTAQPAGVLSGIRRIIDASTTANFIACNKAAGTIANTDLYCYRSNTTPAWSIPANNVLATQTTTSNSKVFDIAIEPSSGVTALAVFVDGTAVPKLKKYSVQFNSWDSASTPITTLPVVASTVAMVPDLRADDIMILIADANQDLRSQVWNGSADSLYALPAGKALFSHGTNGSAITENWYSFAWDGHR